jgi:hypothetical protein
MISKQINMSLPSRAACTALALHCAAVHRAHCTALDCTAAALRLQLRCCWQCQTTRPLWREGPWRLRYGWCTMITKILFIYLFYLMHQAVVCSACGCNCDCTAPLRMHYCQPDQVPATGNVAAVPLSGRPAGSTISSPQLLVAQSGASKLWA